MKENKKNKKVVLVQPFYPFWHKGANNFFYPFALIRLASMIYKDYEVVILDQNIEKNIKKKLLKHLKDKPLLVGITAATGHQIRYGVQISKIVKENSDVPVVWGGKHATILPKQTLEHKYVDIVVPGEGELTFKDLVETLYKKKPLKNVKGIMYKSKGKIFENSKREFMDLNELPDVDYEDIYDFRKYLSTRFASFALNLETSRGCPNNCSYCYNTHDRKWRAMSAEKAIEKINRSIEKNPKNNFAFIWDDNFFVDIKRAVKILENMNDFAIIIQGAEIVSLKKLDDETLERISAVKYLSVMSGVESGSQRIIDLLNKKFKVKDVIELNRRLKKFKGIQFIFNIMIGMPHETREDRKKSLRLIAKLVKENKNSIVDNLKIFTPYPGTRIYEEALKLGFRPPESLEGWADYSWEQAKLPWLSKKERKEIERFRFMSYFIDRKYQQLYLQYNIRHFILLPIVTLFRPIFRFRYNHYFSGFFVEKWIYDFTVKIFRLGDSDPVDKE